MLAAMQFGQEAIGAFCDAQLEFVAEWEQVNGAIVKREYPLDQPVEEVHDRIFAHYDEMAAALRDATSSLARIRSPSLRRPSRPSSPRRSRSLGSARSR